MMPRATQEARRVPGRTRTATTPESGVFSDDSQRA